MTASARCQCVQPAVLVGRSIADLMTSALCAVIVAATGLAVGWRPHGSIAAVIQGFALVLFFAYSLSWIAASVGLKSKSPESAASFGFIVLFPLAFVSNAMVPTQHMPGWLQAIADWNPVSAVTAGVRHLWQNPNPSSTVHAWPMQHPAAAALLWSALILIVAAPLASHIYKPTHDRVTAAPPSPIPTSRRTLQTQDLHIGGRFSSTSPVRSSKVIDIPGLVIAFFAMIGFGVRLIAVSLVILIRASPAPEPLVALARADQALYETGLNGRNNGRYLDIELVKAAAQ